MNLDPAVSTLRLLRGFANRFNNGRNWYGFYEDGKLEYKILYWTWSQERKHFVETQARVGFVCVYEEI